MEKEVILVEEMMVPLEEYATVSEDATLLDAVNMLEKVQDEYDREHFPYLHRAVLVYDEDKKIVGKISQIDVLKALEPKYDEIGDMKRISLAGFSPKFFSSLIDKYALCDRSFIDMCSQAAARKVKEFMYTPGEGEYVEEDVVICEAVHQLIIGHHQSLLVTSGSDIVGVLRLTDVFKRTSQTIKTCNN